MMVSMQNIIATVLALFMVACASDNGPGLVLYADDIETLPYARAAAAMWNAEAGVELVTVKSSWEPIEDRPCWSATIEWSDTKISGDDRSGQEVRIDDCHHVLTIRRGYDSIATVRILAHEVGHALGLEHEKDDVSSVMHPWPGTNVSDFSLQALHDLGELVE